MSKPIVTLTVGENLASSLDVLRKAYQRRADRFQILPWRRDRKDASDRARWERE